MYLIQDISGLLCMSCRVEVTIRLCVEMDGLTFIVLYCIVPQYCGEL
jgi:hypothetical protein